MSKQEFHKCNDCKFLVKIQSDILGNCRELGFKKVFLNSLNLCIYFKKVSNNNV